jgi:hypothetical protein
MRGVITTSGSGWATAGHHLGTTVELRAFRTFRAGRKSESVVVARSYAETSIARDGKDITFRFTMTIPVIDTARDGSPGTSSSRSAHRSTAPRF